MTSQKWDMGGNDLVIDGVYVGATAPGQSGTLLSGSEITVLDGVTAGTVTASKALVVDASKNLATLGDIGTGAITITEAKDIAVGTTTGTKIGAATAQKLGFWNATPVIQQANASQGVVSTTVGSGVATTSATNSTPYGYAQAQADAIVANVNALRVDVLAMNTLLTRLRLDLVTTGIIKGAA